MFEYIDSGYKRNRIPEPLTDTIRVVENATNREGLTLVVPPLNFKYIA